MKCIQHLNLCTCNKARCQPETPRSAFFASFNCEQLPLVTRTYPFRPAHSAASPCVIGRHKRALAADWLSASVGWVSAIYLGDCVYRIRLIPSFPSSCEITESDHLCNIFPSFAEDRASCR